MNHFLVAHFVDVTPEETVQKDAFAGYKESTQTDPQPSEPVS